MPGMMDTILNLGLTRAATDGLAAETGDERFALDSRERLLTGLAAATGQGVAGAAIPDDAAGQLGLAVEAVFRSWDSPRARTYRELHGIDHDLGTAVTVQVMVFGNRDARSGTGVAFSRDPATGAPAPSGDVLFGHQGEDVVAGRVPTRPLADLAGPEPEVWAGLLDAMARVEEHLRDACYLEFTFERGTLWLLQVRPGRFSGAAGVRVAVELAGAGRIGRDEALRRISPRQLARVRVPRIGPGAAVLTRGVGASPGVASGRLATTADRAVRMAAAGPVVLVRPETSPLDMHGLAAAAGVLTALGGPASHAAVVARSLGRPAVVGARDLTVEAGAVRIGELTLAEGTVIAIDGSGGEVVAGTPEVVTGADDPFLQRLLRWADEVSGDRSERPEAERLAAAHAVLGA
jgi:pyruvate,orthophosphate dikinase